MIPTLSNWITGSAFHLFVVSGLAGGAVGIESMLLGAAGTKLVAGTWTGGDVGAGGGGGGGGGVTAGVSVSVAPASNTNLPNSYCASNVVQYAFHATFPGDQGVGSGSGTLGWLAANIATTL